MRSLLTLAACGMLTLGLGAVVADEGKKAEGECCAAKEAKQCADAAKVCKEGDAKQCADAAKVCKEGDAKQCADAAKEAKKADGCCAAKDAKQCADAAKECKEGDAKCAEECAVAAAAADEEKTVTIKGDGLCGKCALKEADECQNVVLVEKEGKKVAYYLEKNEFFKDAHQGLGLCTASKDAPVKVKVVGTLVKKDDKHVLTPTEKITKAD